MFPQHEARDDDAEESAIAVHGDGADRIIDLEAILDIVMQLVGDGGNDRTDQHGLDRMVEVVAGRGGDDAAQAPEKVQNGSPFEMR